MWEAVTADLRGVALAMPASEQSQGVISARFLYEGDVTDFQLELVSLVETYLIADFPEVPATLGTSFKAIARADRQLLDGEEWFFLRREPDKTQPS